MIEVIIKNNYSYEFNISLITAAAEKIDIDFDTVTKIIIVKNLINFVTK